MPAFSFPVETTLFKCITGLTLLSTSGWLIYRANQQAKRRQLQHAQPGARIQNNQSLSQQLSSALFGSEEGRTDLLTPSSRRVLLHTLAYLIGGLTITGTTMTMVGSTIGTSGQLAGLLCTLVGLLGVKLLPRTRIFLKHLYFTLFAIGNGLALSPLMIISSTIGIPVLALSSGLVVSLSLLAISVRRKSLLYLHAPLVAGSTVLLISSLLESLISSPSRSMNGFDYIRLYGGLLLFSGYILYDIQQLISRTDEIESIVRDEIRARSAGVGQEGRPFRGVAGPSGVNFRNEGEPDFQPASTWQNAYSPYPIVNLDDEKQQLESIQTEEQQIVSVTTQSIDVVSESVDFYLDFVNIALRVLEIYLRNQAEEEEQKRKQQQQQQARR